MRVDTVSNLGQDGLGYITVEAVEPRIDSHDLFVGGKMFHFAIDWIKQTTRLYEFSYNHGAPTGFSNCLKTWKDEVLTPEECLKYCENNFNN